MTKKKNSSGKTIFILILLIILFGGGYFGYKYYTDDNSAVAASADVDIAFPIEDTWYVQDIGYNDNALNFSEYTFEASTITGGKRKGKVHTVVFEEDRPTRTGDYEVIGENKLLLSFPNELDYEFTYTYDPEEEKIAIKFLGEDRILTRTNPAAQLMTPEEEAQIVQTQLWMDKIADVDWKGAGDHKIRFHKPTQEGDIITGEYEEYISNEIIFCTYERLADGELNVTRVKSVRNGVEKPLSGDIIFKMQLDEEGNTLTLDNGYRTFIFTH